MPEADVRRMFAAFLASFDVLFQEPPWAPELQRCWMSSSRKPAPPKPAPKPYQSSLPSPPNPQSPPKAIQARLRGRRLEAGMMSGCTSGYWRLQSDFSSRAGGCKPVGGHWGADGSGWGDTDSHPRGWGGRGTTHSSGAGVPSPHQGWGVIWRPPPLPKAKSPPPTPETKEISSGENAILNREPKMTGPV